MHRSDGLFQIHGHELDVQKGRSKESNHGCYREGERGTARTTSALINGTPAVLKWTANYSHQSMLALTWISVHSAARRRQPAKHLTSIQRKLMRPLWNKHRYLLDWILHSNYIFPSTASSSSSENPFNWFDLLRTEIFWSNPSSHCEVSDFMHTAVKLLDAPASGGRQGGRYLVDMQRRGGRSDELYPPEPGGTGSSSERHTFRSNSGRRLTDCAENTFNQRRCRQIIKFLPADFRKGRTSFYFEMFSSLSKFMVQFVCSFILGKCKEKAWECPD